MPVTIRCKGCGYILYRGRDIVIVKPRLRNINGLDWELERFKSKIHRLFVCNSEDAYQPIARAATREVIKKLI